MNLDLWRGKILNLGDRRTWRNVHRAIEKLPERINQRAAALVSYIICLPKVHQDLDVMGCSFDSSGAVIIFQDPDGDGQEEQNTVVHELLHLLDPGWEHEELLAALKADKCRAAWRADPMEAFAEIGSAMLLGGRKYPHAEAVVERALNWEN